MAFCGSFHASQVLPHEPWFGPLAANVGDVKWLPRDHGKRERRAEDLSAAVLSGEF